MKKLRNSDEDLLVESWKTVPLIKTFCLGWVNNSLALTADCLSRVDNGVYTANNSGHVSGVNIAELPF